MTEHEKLMKKIVRACDQHTVVDITSVLSTTICLCILKSLKPETSIVEFKALTLECFSDTFDLVHRELVAHG